MSAAIKIEVTKDTVSPVLEQMGRELWPKMVAEIGPRGTRLMVRNFLKQGTNKKGWTSTHFWSRAAQSTNWQYEPKSDSGGTVSIGTAQIGVGQRLEGGPIKPVNAGALTIPISPVSYGRTAADFPGSFVIWTAKGAYIVQRGESVDSSGKVTGTNARSLGGNFKRRRQAALNFLFKLSKGVVQDPDPNVFPSEEEFAEVVEKSADVVIERFAQ